MEAKLEAAKQREVGVVVVAGPPGSGKGTQCVRLARRLGLRHVSTGDVFRYEVACQTELGAKVDQYVRRGDYVPDDITMSVVAKYLEEVGGKGVLLDGFPRTYQQAHDLTARFPVERLILVQLSDAQCINRVLHRRVDPETGDIYHLLNAPPPPEVAGRLIRRDVHMDEGAIRKRLRAWHANLGLILPYFRGKIQVVNGAQTADEAFEAIVSHLAEPPPEAPEPAPVVAAPSPVVVSKCSICFDQPANFLVLPCGHQCGCEPCLRKSGGSCPICRTPTEGIVRVYQVGEADMLLEAEEPLEPAEDCWEDAEEAEDGDELLRSVGQVALKVEPCEDIPPEGGEVNVAVSIRVPDAMARSPVDICCVVDVSASMGQTASYEDENGEMKDDGLTYLDIVKHSVKAMMHTLSEQDRFALVAFHSNASTAYVLTEMTAGARAQAVDALEALTPQGQTNIWDGMHKGMEQLRAEGEGQRKKFLMLLTDGQPNLKPPEGEVGELKTYMEGHPDFRFQMNTFGFGYNLDSRLLLNLAEEANGTYAFIPDVKIVGTCFVNSVANAVSTFVQNTTLHLSPGSDATFAGSTLGNLRTTDTSWGRVVDLGPLQLGQTRDVVVPMHVLGGDGSYLGATLTYANNTGGEERCSIKSSVRKASQDAATAFYRSEAVSMIAAAIKDADANQGQRANQTILALRGKLSSASLVDDKNEQLKCLKDDVDGRISKALTGKERFVRWGRHYLRAINRSHQVQQCTNFMDPGLQVYGGGLFKEVQDLGGKAFLELPAPKPARRPSSACLSHYANPKPSANMQTYYAGAGGGCFGAESSVVVVRGDGREVRTRITDVVAGDSVRVPDGTARVVCCARISRPGKGLLRFPGGLTITPRHPVRVGGQWRHPGDLGQADPVPNPSGYVYNVLLDRCHILLVDGLECITWGHKLPDPAHEFFGSERVVGALAELPGWSRGLVLIDAYLRDARTGRVAGFLGAEQGGTPEILPDARRTCAV